MRISDWSSDVCSSDLRTRGPRPGGRGMKTVFQIQKPDDMQATIVLTATVGDFRALRTQLSGKWPSAEFSRSIGDVIRQAESTFYAAETEQTQYTTGTN